MRLTDAIVSLHPAAVTTAFVVLFAGSGMLLNLGPMGAPLFEITYSATTLALMAPLTLWHYSLYRAATDRTVEIVGHRGRRGFLFLLTVGTLGVFLIVPPLLTITNVDNRDSPLLTFAIAMMPLGCIAYFASIWAASNALTRSDEASRSVEFHKTLGTFILEMYLPIGIWVIYPRIKRMLAAPIQTQATA